MIYIIFLNLYLIITLKGVLKGEEYFKKHVLSCKLIAIGCVTICSTSYLNMVLIAINR